MRVAAFWLELTQRELLLRALKASVLVGPVLAAINHGDTILEGDAPASIYLKIAFTFLVPFCVSAFSSASAALAISRQHARGSPGPG